MSFHEDSFHQVKSRKQVQKYLEEIEPDNLSPRQAIDALYDLKHILRKPLK